MTLEERKTEFCKLVYEKLGNESLTDFLDYWTEHSINGKKMRFEKEKVFDIKRRWGTWSRNNIKFQKPVKQNAIHGTMDAFNQIMSKIDNGQI